MAETGISPPQFDGWYLIAVPFSGYFMTLHLVGPWGKVSAQVGRVEIAEETWAEDSAVVAASWTAKAGERLHFSVHCVANSNDETYRGRVSLQSIQFMRLIDFKK